MSQLLLVNFDEMEDIIAPFYSNKISQEVPFSQLKKPLQEASVKFGFDFEPSVEFIETLHPQLHSISAIILKENLLQWLKKERHYYSMLLVGEESQEEETLIEESKLLQPVENDKIIFNHSSHLGLDLTILHRSLYILKRKIELNEPKIENLYSKYGKSDSKQLSMNLFLEFAESYFKSCDMLIINYSSGGDIFKAESLSKPMMEEVFPKVLLKLRNYVALKREEMNEAIEKKKNRKPAPQNNSLNQSVIK